MESVKTKKNLNKRPYVISYFPLPKPNLLFNKQRVKNYINRRNEHEQRLLNTEPTFPSSAPHQPSAAYQSVDTLPDRHFPAGVLVSPSYFAIANPNSFNSSCNSQILQGSCHNLAHLSIFFVTVLFAVVRHFSTFKKYY